MRYELVQVAQARLEAGYFFHPDPARLVPSSQLSSPRRFLTSRWTQIIARGKGLVLA